MLPKEIRAINYVPQEITVRNKVLTGIFSLRTLSLTVISRESSGEPILLYVSLLGAFLSSN
jgi:hypothetical protein